MTKLESLILYILDRAGPREFTWLAYCLYLIELEHYLKTAKTITGARWYKRSWGIELEGLTETIEKMEREGSLVRA